MGQEMLQKLTALDEEIAALLEKRVQLWNQLDDAGHSLSQPDMDQLVSNWLEMAADFEFDEELIEKMAKILNSLCRRAEG